MGEEQNPVDPLASGPQTGPWSGCPASDKLAALAAGLSSAEEGDALLYHASRCDACGAMLRTLVEEFAEETTEAESRTLESAKPDWQRDIARRIAQTSPRKAPLPIRTWLARAAALIVALVAGRLAWDHWTASDPARLLAEAYTRQRPFAFRIPGAGYAPLRQERAAPSSSFQRPRALLLAGVRIASELEKDADDAKWLELLARAEMLELSPEDAIANLKHALERRPDDPNMMADLGMAYALRAEVQPGRAVDYAYAIDYLEHSLRTRPKSLVTVFNLALVFEDMNSVDDAIREWRRYLALDPSGPWCVEVQRRLTDLEQKKRIRQAALEQISDKIPDRLLRSIDKGATVEPEEYLDIAVTEWLPRRWEDVRYQHVLDELAKRFIKQHNDPWLQDALAAKPTKDVVNGLTALAAAVKANLSDETDRALEESTEASRKLRAADSNAAAVRSQWEHIYALHWSAESASNCINEASVVAEYAEAQGYSRILGQVLIERGNCRAITSDSAGAGEDFARGLRVASEAGYDELALRASGILADLQTESGNMMAAWTSGVEGLAKFWRGTYSGIRAQQIYFNLGRSAKGLGLLQTSHVFRRAAVSALAETAHHRLEAIERGNLARAAVEAGSPLEAVAELDRADRLFGEMQQTERLQKFRALMNLHRAESQIASMQAQSALGLLEEMRPMAPKLNEPDLIDYESLMGDALQQTGRPADAEQSYQRAITVGKRSLSTLRGFRNRTQLLAAAAQPYRGLVQVLYNRGDSEDALRLWESFHANELPSAGLRVEIPVGLPQFRSESFVSYVMLRDKALVWLSDDRGVETRQLTFKVQDLDNLATRFLRECADPGSDQRALIRDSRQLYEWLIAPISDRLDPKRALIVEPDGAVGAVPIQALLDEHLHYLGERFAITVASGMADYQRRSQVTAVSKKAEALVVADPTVGRSLNGTFPPLPGALAEGKAIAKYFDHCVLLPGEKATLRALEQNRSVTEVLHFAGHGFSNAGNGGLLLSPDLSHTADAGILDAKALAHQNWSRCRLAVLSACSAGAGENQGPVNPESLVRGLLWAGVARVVASRWNVADQSGFMNYFYAELLSGTDVAHALENAAQRIREKKETSHPYYWAGFQNFGAR
jgi:CHAT domain-containing protein